MCCISYRVCEGGGAPGWSPSLTNKAAVRSACMQLSNGVTRVTRVREENVTRPGMVDPFLLAWPSRPLLPRLKKVSPFLSLSYTHSHTHGFGAPCPKESLDCQTVQVAIRKVEPSSGLGQVGSSLRVTRMLQDLTLIGSTISICKYNGRKSTYSA